MEIFDDYYQQKSRNIRLPISHASLYIADKYNGCQRLINEYERMNE